MADSCSTVLSWLARSCLPDPAPISPHPRAPSHVTLTSLPDDLLIEILSRVPNSSLPSLSLSSRRLSLLLRSPSFLLRRRSLGLLRPRLLAFSLPLRHARLVALGPSIYLLAPSAAARLDAWTNSVSPLPPPILPRKRFAAAAVGGRVYVAGGSAAEVEEYDPATNAWRIVAVAPRRRHGCVAAGAGGVLYVIGGLKVGGGRLDAYASTMDAYDVGAGAWIRTKGIPGAGCAVGACAAGGKVYVMASHAVEVSFWRWEMGEGRGGREWARLRAPPVPGRVGVAGSMRFACVGVGESTVAVVVEMGEGDGLVLFYDIIGDEWNRGCGLPRGFQRAGCVAVEF